MKQPVSNPNPLGTARIVVPILPGDPLQPCPELLTEADIPERPADRPGFVTELVLRDSRWSWRQRRMDDADRAYAACLAAMGGAKAVKGKAFDLVALAHKAIEE